MLKYYYILWVDAVYYIRKRWKDENRNFVQKTDLYNDIKYLLDNVYNKGTNGENRNMTEHEFMSQFVEVIAYSLAVYDNNRHPMDYYMAMSWAGLETSSLYQNKTQQEKDAIQKIINYERNNR